MPIESLIMSSSFPPEIEAHIAEILPSLIETRRDIHRHPEIGFKEVRTAEMVARRLRELGLEVTEGIGITGVVGTLRAGNSNRAIGFRADMDALAMNEATGLPHASQIEGMMHGCGHDGHTTMLLGAAEVLAKNPCFSGTIHFIFQPAEEGLGGAPAMMRDGLFERFPVDAVYGLHNKPNLPANTFNVTIGAMLAAADMFTVVFGGQGGHGGSGAYMSVDPTMAAAQFVTNLQAIIGRNISPFDQGVISVGHINGGSFDAPNVIPSRVVIRGTVRSFSPKTRDLLERRLNEVARAAADAFSTTLEVTYDRLFPSLHNPEESTSRIVEALRKRFGHDRVDDKMVPVTGAEDFAYMLEQSTGCFFFIGAGDGPALHSTQYDFNDNLIADGIRYWVTIAQEELPV
ncbi:hydrolase [Nitratireductor aestuarii]|uniref:Hydrolase n=1 Tax=Nitratireductor aestuarii TaxID=1735103 RepID=A0A916RQX5_9HYPH|nr:amidohydrolase [Nitratireductor aestuarii]GGA65953.1 hydrolase [Nitratireductor aestuarii]